MNTKKSTSHNKENLKEVLLNALQQPIETIEAKTYRKSWRTKSNPVLLRCEDKKDYVVKGRQAGRQIINDQIVARLGLQIQAPVGNPKIVNISQDLIDIEPNLKDFGSGTAHGTEFIDGCFDEWSLIATSEPENRIRLATLALLYGWTHANDRQFIFRSKPPRIIYSVDHGHFFPNPPNWELKHLKQDSSATLDEYFKNCNFIVTEIFNTGNDLLEVTLHEQPEPEEIKDTDLSQISRRSKRKKYKKKKAKVATILIPFVNEIVPVVDLENKRIEITPPEGLV